MGRRLKQIKEKICMKMHFSIRDTIFFLLTFAAAFVICLILQRFSENDVYVPMIFILVVLVVSRLTEGYFYGLLSSVLGVFAVNYMFTYPYFALNFTLTGYPLTFLVMLLVCLITCTMTSQIKAQKNRIRENEKEQIRAGLLRAISHDIRTPLTAIVGASNVLLSDDLLDKNRKKELLEDINSDAQWLIHMVENILSITRMQDAENAMKKEPEAVEEVIAVAVTKFRKQWPNIKVNVVIPAEVLFVPMDATLIEQVIQNILSNSAIHGKNCTEINILVEGKSDKAIFSFRDNGCGFDQIRKSSSNYSQQVSQIAGKSDGNRNMGIGLSVCRTIINAHKGQLLLSNAEDGGAIVTFSLPLNQ